jgi:acyl-CoA synthetase (AMP-forming)/AMP-acid ligase II
LPEPLPRGRNPFDETGVVRDADGCARYVDRPPSLVHTLRASAERDPQATAVLEVAGPSIGYGELWERSARVAGGLRAAGVGRGDRVAIRLGNGIDWVLAFFGAQLAGAVVVPVNTRFTEEEVAYVVEDSGAAYTFAPGAALPEGPPVVTEDLGRAVPDEMMGEKVGAVLVAAAGAQVDVEVVIAHCREHLADFKVPQYVAVREQPLPRNPGGKILKAQLREQTSWGAPLR